MILRYLTVVLVVCGSMVMQGSVTAQTQSLVLEDFQTKDAEGFPLNWEHENQRSQSKGRDAYKIQTEDGVSFLSVKDAGQRIKKKKMIGTPRPFPSSPGVGVCKKPRRTQSRLRRSMPRWIPI